MVERMVGSTSSASYVHGVKIDNNNPYRTMIMDAIRMNQGHVIQCPIVDEKPNIDTTRFFKRF
jgi:stress response protein YsnF